MPFTVLVIALSFDTSILMIENGERIKSFDKKEALLHSTIFAVIATTMLLIGDYLTYILYHDHFIFFARLLKCAILVVKAVILLFEGLFHKQVPEHKEKHFNYANSAKDAFIAGIDMLLISLCIFYKHIPIATQALIMFTIMFVQVLASLYLGFKKGHKYTKAICYSCFIMYMIIAIIHLSELFI